MSPPPAPTFRVRLPAGFAPPGLEETLRRYVVAQLRRTDPQTHARVEIGRPGEKPSITTERGGLPPAALDEALAFALTVWERVLGQEVEAGGGIGRELDCLCGTGFEHALPPLLDPFD